MHCPGLTPRGGHELSVCLRAAPASPRAASRHPIQRLARITDEVEESLLPVLGRMYLKPRSVDAVAEPERPLGRTHGDGQDGRGAQPRLTMRPHQA